ncbi:MAG: hypothetical protein ABR508_00005 [Candidatus Baltobacteraceae bacterium]
MSLIPYYKSVKRDTQMTLREKQIARRYTIQLAGLMALYVVVLLASIRTLQTHHFGPVLQALVAATPALPMFGVVAAVIQFMLGIDELQRQIHLEALAIAAGITAALAMTYTFLEGAGLPHSQAWWAFACVDIIWAVSLPFVKRRYA